MEEKRKRRKECSGEFLHMDLTDEIKIVDVINAGSFGDIYLGRNKVTNVEYAIKFDKNETPRTQKNFFKEYVLMQEIEGKGLFPKCELSQGAENVLGKSALIMEILGCNIYDTFKLCDRELDVATVALLIQSFIKRLEELHDCGILHRDIKPENFCLGGEEMREVYLIDFGLSCAYIEDDGSHKSFSKNSGFVGTPRYASRFAHQGFTQGRRDDLEAVGYMCIFLIKGKLPWQNVKIKDKKLKHQFLNNKKSGIKLSELCEDLPQEFVTYLEAVRGLAYEDRPEYGKYIAMFRNLIKREKWSESYCWEDIPDFEVLKNKYLSQSEFGKGKKSVSKSSTASQKQNKQSKKDDDSFEMIQDEIFDEPQIRPSMAGITKTPGMLLGDDRRANGFLKQTFKEDHERLDYGYHQKPPRR